MTRLIVLLVALAWAAAATADPVLQRIRHTGILRIAIDPTVESWGNLMGEAEPPPLARSLVRP